MRRRRVSIKKLIGIFHKGIRVQNRRVGARPATIATILETQLPDDRKIDHRVGIERLVGQSSFDGAIDDQLDLVTLGQTAGIQRRHQSAVKLVGELLVELKEFANPMGDIGFVLRIADGAHAAQHRAEKFFDFNGVAANLVLGSADAAPGQADNRCRRQPECGNLRLKLKRADRREP